MKAIYFCMMFLCVFAAAGCGGSEDNALATDGATEEDFANYERELAAVSGDDSYEASEESDNATE